MRNAIALLITLWCAMAAAEVKVYPTDNNQIGIATSATDGRWAVFRAAPFGPVQSFPCTINGETGCMWTAESGVFTALLIPNDQTMPFEFGTVTLGPKPKPDPDPDPDPDPSPPPGARQVIFFHESGARPVGLAQLVDDVQDWGRPLGHKVQFLDDDIVDENGNVLPRKTAILKAISDQNIELPAMAIIARSRDKEWILPYAIPASSAKAIELIKESGG